MAEFPTPADGRSGLPAAPATYARSIPPVSSPTPRSPAWPRRGGRFIVVVLAVVSACAAEEQADDTLAPLPVPSIAETTTTPVPSTVPLTVAPVTVSTTVPDQPVGDWDGARFDAGAIQDVDDLDIYKSIEFDRFSYQDPILGLVDAAGFAEEPIAYWWPEDEDPYENISANTREFVLTPNVELLVLAEDGEEAACKDPPPFVLPPPLWQGVDISFLDTNAAFRSVALLTYAPNGAVTRVRFTRGCD
ncbi:MAG: hypothetical protein M3487_06600 [Actinomycetota bacterium]|nr:hypothetical protein [Actinomycetota bacterium]